MSRKLLERLKGVVLGPLARARASLSPDATIAEADLRKVAESIDDVRRPAVIGLSILGGGILLLVLWAFLAPLDEGVPALGTITVESKRKVVQHLSGGIIKKILVREAQEVKAGEPIVLMDDTTAKANFDASRQEYFTLQAQADRLQAEMARAGTVAFSPALLDARDDAVAAEAMANQQRLFATRRLALQGETAILETAERSAQEYVIGLRAQSRGKQDQLKFVREQLEGSRQLAKEGYLPRNRWFEEERLAADLQASVNELDSSVLRATSQAIEAKQRLSQRQRDFQKEVETDFSNTRKAAMVAAERFRAAREDFLRTVVRAPVDGKVNGLTALTDGSVVAPGGRLLDVVPRDEMLVLDVKVDPNVIDRVHKDLPVEISMQAFADDPRLVLEGVLISISPDLVSDSNPALPPYYLGRVQVNAASLKKLGTRVLQPGMPAQVMIKTGERTLVQYLLKPLLMRLAGAMKES